MRTVPSPGRTYELTSNESMSTPIAPPSGSVELKRLLAGLSESESFVPLNAM